jgi:hypothetical protein
MENHLKFAICHLICCFLRFPSVPYAFNGRKNRYAGRPVGTGTRKQVCDIQGGKLTALVLAVAHRKAIYRKGPVISFGIIGSQRTARTGTPGRGRLFQGCAVT